MQSAVPTDCASLGLRALRDRGGMWQEKLKKTSYGDFSFAMYEANYVMEDTSQVRLVISATWALWIWSLNSILCKLG